MNGLPEDIDLSPIVGRQLVQLRFGAWNVGFEFDGPVRVVVESTILICGKDGASRRIEDFRAGASDLCRLIGLNVVGADRSSAGGITLQMSSGDVVDLENSVTAHEAFQLYIGDRTFVA